MSSHATGPLAYTIPSCSAYSGKYCPQNILRDSPLDSSSRWSGAQHSSDPQWILLKLDAVSVVQSITFGKYYKSHPCNMKEFKVLMGMTEDTLTEVLHASLKDTKDPETFSIQHQNSSRVHFPSRFVKVVPISTHSQSFHTSIWYVALAGVTDPTFLDQVTTSFAMHSETTLLRHILKYLRQRRFLTPYEDILTRSGLHLEHPLVSQLYHNLVIVGSWTMVEELLHQIADAGLFDDYLRRRHQPEAVWTRLLGTDADGDRPSARGGHAMCMDQTAGIIYLFGGWDGQKSLDDFWAYDTAASRWRVLSHNTSVELGPTPRFCHKMVFDPKSGKIYILGGVDDHSAATFSDFYCYHTTGPIAGQWDFLAQDTSTSGGPSRIYDHQMVLDPDSRTIYVFGGRIADGVWGTTKLSGLYSFNIKTSKWRHLQPSSSPASVSIPPRFGHSMILDPVSRKLLMFAGRREDVYLSDLYSYDIATNTAVKVAYDISAAGPPPCFTQRAVLDPHMREIYVFCGLTREGKPGDSTIIASEEANWMFSYDPRPGKWLRINSSSSHPDGTPAEIPQGRYAHQVVYDHAHQTVFLHGGNGGVAGEPMEKAEPEASKHRLDDFWSMKLQRPSPSEIIRRCVYHSRQQQFTEMCSFQPPQNAVDFLQNDVFQVVNHDDPTESESFRGLLMHLVSPQESVKLSQDEPDEVRPRTRSKSELSEEDMEGVISAPSSTNCFRAQLLQGVEDPAEKNFRQEIVDDKASEGISGTQFSQRNHVFEQIMEYISPRAKQPSGNLSDLLSLDLTS